MYRKIEAEEHLKLLLTQKYDIYKGLIKDLTEKRFMCKPDAQKDLDAFVKRHKKGIYSPFAHIRHKFPELLRTQQKPLLKDSKDPKSPYVYPQIQ